MPLNIRPHFQHKTSLHIVMKSLQPDFDFSRSFPFIMAQIMTRFSQPIVQKPEQPDALISGTVKAMRTVGYPVKPDRNQTAFGVRVTQNDSLVMPRVIHENAMTLTPPWAGGEIARCLAHRRHDRRPDARPKAVGRNAPML